MPTYNSPERWLAACLDSVLAQDYPHWELCIADDASPDPARAARPRRVRRARPAHPRDVPRAQRPHRRGVEQRAGAGPRRVRRAARPRRPAAAARARTSSPPAIGDAPRRRAASTATRTRSTRRAGATTRTSSPTGIDELARRAELRVATSASTAPTLVRAVGGFREGCEGAQDWDLAAARRATRPAPRDIVHIPRILYHWRAIEGSTARSMDSKSYAAAAQERAVADALRRARRSDDAEPASSPGRSSRPTPLGTPPAFALVVAARVGDATRRHRGDRRGSCDLGGARARGPVDRGRGGRGRARRGRLAAVGRRRDGDRCRGRARRGRRRHRRRRCADPRPGSAGAAGRARGAGGRRRGGRPRARPRTAASSTPATCSIPTRWRGPPTPASPPAACRWGRASSWCRRCPPSGRACWRRAATGGSPLADWRRRRWRGIFATSTSACGSPRPVRRALWHPAAVFEAAQMRESALRRRRRAGRRRRRDA